MSPTTMAVGWMKRLSVLSAVNFHPYTAPFCALAIALEPKPDAGGPDADELVVVEALEAAGGVVVVLAVLVPLPLLLEFARAGFEGAGFEEVLDIAPVRLEDDSGELSSSRLDDEVADIVGLDTKWCSAGGRDSIDTVFPIVDESARSRYESRHGTTPHTRYTMKTMRSIDRSIYLTSYLARSRSSISFVRYARSAASLSIESSNPYDIVWKQALSLAQSLSLRLLRASYLTVVVAQQ